MAKMKKMTKNKVEYPVVAFIVASLLCSEYTLRHTRALFMLSNQHPDKPHL